MAARCPHSHCGKIVEKLPDGRYPSKCPHCGLLLKPAKPTPAPAKTPAKAAVAKPASPPAGMRQLRCPHAQCGKTILHDAADPIPTRCPHCGLLLSPKIRPPRQSPAERQSPSAPAAPPVPAERVVRSFSAQPDHPFASDDSDEEVPFLGAPAASTPASSSVPAFLAAADGGSAPPFAAGSTSRSPLPTARSAAAYSAKYQQPGDYTKWIVFGVLLLAAAGAGWHFRDDLMGNNQNRATADAEGVIRNAGRNYLLKIPPGDWKLDEKRQQELSVDLALHDAAANAWITIVTGTTAGAVPTLGQLKDELTKSWETDLVGMQPEPEEDATLAGKPALRVVATGEEAGENVRKEGYVMFNDGIWYRLVFTAPSATADNSAQSFASAFDSFELMGSREGWRDQLGTSTSILASSKYPYQIRVPQGGWKKVATSETESSRFADMNLVDQATDGMVEISVRETTDVKQMKERYVKRLEQLYQKVVVRPPEEELTIYGREAVRMQVIIEDPSVAVNDFIMTAFVLGDKHVYQIECRAPAGKAPTYTPIFVKMINGFQVLDKVPEQKAEPKLVAKKEPEKAKRSEPTVAKSDMAEEGDAPESDDEKPKAKAAAKPASEPTVAQSKPKSAGGKRPSLDDLDAPGGESDAEEKKADEAPKKKGSALDDLDAMPEKSAPKKKAGSALDDLDAKPSPKKDAEGAPKKKGSALDDLDMEEKAEPKPKTDEEEKSDAKPKPSKKRSALDDLDAEDKPDEEKSDDDKPAEKPKASKKRSALDDLD